MSIESPYPKWIIKACDRIANKPADDPLTNEESEAMSIYLHGEECVECGKDSWTCEHYKEYERKERQ